MLYFISIILIIQPYMLLHHKVNITIIRIPYKLLVITTICLIHYHIKRTRMLPICAFVTNTGYLMRTTEIA